MGIGDALLGICILFALVWLWAVTTPRKVSTMDETARITRIVYPENNPHVLRNSFVGGLLFVVVVLVCLFGLAYLLAGAL